MKEWLIGILGISFLGVMLDILIKDSNNMKYIKSVYSLIVLYVVLTPVISFLLNFKQEENKLNEQIEIASNVYGDLQKIKIESIFEEEHIRNYFIFKANDTIYEIYIYEGITNKKLEDLQEKFDQNKINVILKVIN